MLEIRPITTRKELKSFVQYPIGLYRGNDCYVPPLINADVDSLDYRVNPAFEFCEVVCYMAYRDGVAVGRIAGIINRRFNEKYGAKQCRFGYVDFIDDTSVSAALLDTIAEWGRKKGMEYMVGPMGMTDLDYEGCLTEGFDQLSTIVTIYNYPYYRKHFEDYGMTVDAKWKEYKIRMPESVPDKFLRVASFVKKRMGLKVIKETNSKRIVEKYGRKIFELYNLAYAPLYGFTPLTDHQIEYYIKLYLPQVRLDCVRLVVDNADNLVGVGVTCPSLSRAQQKAKGRLWPFGFYHMLNALYGRGTDIWDLYLIGVHPDYQGKGVNALIFAELIPQGIANGYKWVETNPELESNNRVQAQWEGFDYVCHKRRCSFKISIKK